MAEITTRNSPASEYGCRDIFSAGVCSCMSPSTRGPHGQYSFADNESAIVVGSVKTTETTLSSRHAEESSRSSESVSREHAEESPRSSEPVSRAPPIYLRIGIDNNTRTCNEEEEFEVTVDAFTHGQQPKIEPRSKRRVGSNVNKVWRSVRQNSLYFKRSSSMIKRSATNRSRVPLIESPGTAGSF